MYVHDGAGLMAGNALVQTIHMALTSATAANQTAASAITPPGSEGASVRAVGQQMMSIDHFGAMLAMGLEQLEERIGSTGIFAVTSEMTEAMNEASTMISSAVGTVGSVATGAVGAISI